MRSLSSTSLIWREHLIPSPNIAPCIPHAEEKVDGANLGVSFDPSSGSIRFQKRGHWIAPSRLVKWAACRISSWILFANLATGPPPQYSTKR